MPAARPPFKRFHDNVPMNPNENGCWIWQGHSYPNGYGCLKVFGKTVSAHRYAYSLYCGPIPDGMEILHTCDVRKCVNPDHLNVGTHAQNMAEAKSRGRMRSGKGHPAFGRPSPLRGSGSTQSIPVRVKGRLYGSIKEAERSLGVASGSVRYWLNKKPNLAEVISKEEYENVISK